MSQQQPPNGPYEPIPGQQLPYSSFPPAVGPQYPYAPPPPSKKRHWVRNTFIGLGALFALLLVISVVAAALSGPKTTKLNSSAGSPGTAAPGPTASASQAAAPSTASIGGTFKVTDSSGNVYDVTLLKVIDPAQGSDDFNQPDNGNRFVAAVFRLTGVSGTSSDDSNSDASLTGGNQQVYQPDFDSIAAYTNFNDGDFNVIPGQSETGAVTFQVPDSVNVSNIQWTVGFDSSTATWNVG
jgi:hypothetical protein